MASQKTQLLRALQAYDQSPRKGDYPRETLRNMMMAAQAHGIDWEPDFSMKRAALSAADGFLMGMLPGNHALTKGERMAGSVGDIAGLVVPGAFAAKGAKYGGKAAAKYLGGAGSKTLGTTGAKASSKMQGFLKSKSDDAIGAMRSERAALLDDAGKVISGKGKAVAELDKRILAADKAANKMTDRFASFEKSADKLSQFIGEKVTGNSLLQSAIEYGTGFGAVGAVRGGVEAAQDDPTLGGLLGGMIDGGVSGAVMGAAGGAIGPWAGTYAKAHPYVAGGAGLGLGSMMIDQNYGMDEGFGY